MTVLRAFGVGVLAGGAVAFVLAAALALAASSAAVSFRAGIGPLLIVAAERQGADVTTTLGSGLVAVAVAAGIANAAVALAIGFRARSRRNEGPIA